MVGFRSFERYTPSPPGGPAGGPYLVPHPAGRVLNPYQITAPPGEGQHIHHTTPPGGYVANRPAHGDTYWYNRAIG